ncbi:MAG: toll/interleukin-1 receptor domain-containing protein [Pseudomonadota bacterium]
MHAYPYKAYLSYSHDDEVWARWLHRALESYRIPRKLTNSIGHLPRRVAPIFRDRDDLVSAADLTEKLRQALRESEALIVICSPKAAASRWVNEEVKFFRTLGREDRIFCVVVGGEPDVACGPSSCFPPSLFEESAGTNLPTLEPLAADPRDSGDGKTLAKLKIVAGLLNVRLDDLRNREAVRSRQVHTLVSAAIVAGVVLLAYAYTTRQGEIQERQSAERLATFIVDIGEELKKEVSLEVLNRTSSRALSYLAEIDPKRLTPETGVKVALAFRQIGQVSDGQGRLAEAEEAYLKSRELLVSLQKQNPDRSELLFELAQSEYYVASHYFNSDRFDEAELPAERYAELANELYQSDPEKLEWQLERSYAATGLLVMHQNSGRPTTAAVLEEAKQAVQIAQEIYDLRPTDPEILLNYSTTLAWSADTKMLACKLEDALSDRQRALAAIRSALAAAPADNVLRESFAYAHSGVADVHVQLGELAIAHGHYRTSIDTFTAMLERDRSNERLREELEWRRLSLVDALLKDGRTAEASEILDNLGRNSEGVERPALESERGFGRYQERLLLRSRAALANLDHVAFVRALETATAVSTQQESPLTVREQRTLIELAMLWKLHTGKFSSKITVPPYEEKPGVSGCSATIDDARLAYIHDRPEAAIAELRYLKGVGYRGQDAAELCSAIPGCDL